MKLKLYESNNFIENEDRIDEDKYEIDEENDYGIEDSDSKLMMVDKVISGINDEAYNNHEKYRAKYLNVEEGTNGVINIYWGTQESSALDDLWYIIETLKHEIYEKYNIDISIHFIYFQRDTSDWLWYDTKFNLSNLNGADTHNVIVIYKDQLVNYIEENIENIDLESLEYDILDILDEASGGPVSRFMDSYDNFRIIYEDELKNNNYNYFDESLYKNIYDEIEEIYNSCEKPWNEYSDLYIDSEKFDESVNEAREIINFLYNDFLETDEEKEELIEGLKDPDEDFCYKFMSYCSSTEDLYYSTSRNILGEDFDGEDSQLWDKDIYFENETIKKYNLPSNSVYFYNPDSYDLFSIILHCATL